MAALACGITWIVLTSAMKTRTTRMIRTMMIDDMRFPVPFRLSVLPRWASLADLAAAGRLLGSQAHITTAVAPSISTTSTC